MALRMWASSTANALRVSTATRPQLSPAFSLSRCFSSVLDGLKYASTHEWVKHEGPVATIGITDHAQDHLGEVVFVELPESGGSVTRGTSFGAVESVKATSDVNSPISGEIVEVNSKLTESPGLINSSPYEGGWMIKVKPSSPPELESLMGAKDLARFMFSASKLANLTTLTKNSEIDDPTRIQVVTALIFNCAMAAAKALSGASLSYILIHPVNLRLRIIPPLPENSVGNFSWFYSIMARDESDKQLDNLVGALKKGIAQMFDKYTKNRTANECYSLICESIKEARKALSNSNGVHVYKCSSMCSYPFNQINFGWGKAIWVGVSGCLIKDTFHLVDAMEEGGIEALVTMEEKKWLYSNVIKSFLRLHR
ncbi:unnamed protein product [Ilex paraguariensis]|uniref:Lipoyl-binding domain-containing protein n=1 Tax=Ilex paraguariensis TaxID=185542 RepID=A0ABC8TV48_9AQUA